MTDELFDRPINVPEELAKSTKAKGWPDDLVERALRLGYSPVDIDKWLSDEHLTVAETVKEIA